MPRTKIPKGFPFGSKTLASLSRRTRKALGTAGKRSLRRRVLQKELVAGITRHNSLSKKSGSARASSEVESNLLDTMERMEQLKRRKRNGKK